MRRSLWIETKYMIANPLTKADPGNVYLKELLTTGWWTLRGQIKCRQMRKRHDYTEDDIAKLGPAE